MFKAFRINDAQKINWLGMYQQLVQVGKNSLSERKRAVRNGLDKYLSPMGELSAREITEDWFPTVEADVFISHSHDDKELVMALVGYLETVGVKVFLDFLAWEYIDDLLRDINNKYNVLLKMVISTTNT